MTRRIALLAAGLAAVVTFGAPQAANACTVDVTCSHLNRVCDKVLGHHCV